MLMAVQIYDPNQPVDAGNQLPPQQIAELGAAGVPPGVTYSFSPYSQPGVSALVGFAPPVPPPGNPDDVPLSTITRAG